MAARKSKSKYGLPSLGETPHRRPARVADLILHEVATLLLGTIKDPRVRVVSITSVTVTDDLRKARIFYSFFGDETVTAESVAAGLESTKGFIRKHLARELNMRYVPELEFRLDLSLVRQEEMDRLFKEIENENGSLT